jgi:amino acid adenylation domain-containing protein
MEAKMRMQNKTFATRASVAAAQNIQQQNYWLDRLAGEPVKSIFPYDFPSPATGDQETPAPVEKVVFHFSSEVEEKITKLSGGSRNVMHMILTANLVVLLNKYSQQSDITAGTVIYKQAIDADFVNTILPLRFQLHPHMTFKELLIDARHTILEANEHYSYPMEILAEHLGMPVSPGGDFPLFDVFILVETIHERKYTRHIRTNTGFYFQETHEGITGTLEYNPRRYRQFTGERIAAHFVRVLEQALSNVQLRLGDIDMLGEDEKKRLLTEFNRTKGDYPADQTLQQSFETQVKKTPDHIALVGAHELHSEGTRGLAPWYITCRELNRKSNRLAGFLRKQGVGPGQIVGLMMEPGFEMIMGIIGILKAGAAYLPINPHYPQTRIVSLLDDSNAGFLVVKEKALTGLAFFSLQTGAASSRQHREVLVTPPRSQEQNLDALQPADRSLVDYEKYRPYIGQAAVKNGITLQFSRGCAFNCAYCFKIWPGKYVVRSAENIFQEMKFYYQVGIRRFAFVDDLPNLDIKNISRLYQLIIQHRMKLHLHFPNGIRGDILTPGHIDLMVEAGTVNMDLALETTSPRLQKLIRKNLNLERLYRNIDYIIKNHPQVILELQIIHGIPTETREEARASLDYLKSLKWLHFPYIHILNIYPGSAMAEIAASHGISREAILRSADLAYHELPETLPFPKSFTHQYQAEFVNEYFMAKERLLAVLPHQMKVLTEDESVQKYNSYLPVEIHTFSQLLNHAGITRDELKGEFLPEDYGKPPDFNTDLKKHFTRIEPSKHALRLLLLDLSQYFAHEEKIIYDVVEPPLGLMYVLTHLHREFPGKIHGKIAKSRIDFAGFDQLKSLIFEFQPEIIGVRTLNFYKNFFHKTISLIRQWGIGVPIIAGGPYATSSYSTMLQDDNIDLAVVGEGEMTFAELIGKILENNHQLPSPDILKQIPGLVFVPSEPGQYPKGRAREIVIWEQVSGLLAGESTENPPVVNRSPDPAYIIYTSGSTGHPKGVIVQHNNVVNQVTGLVKQFAFDASLHYILLAAFTFDVSVMHIFLSLTTGAKLFLINDETRKDAAKLWNFIYRTRIDIINIVPAFMEAILQDLEKKWIYFKYLFVGGDVFKRSLLDRLQQTFNVEQIFNIYGPTETTINAALYPCVESALSRLGNIEAIPIGKPLMNYRVYILDNDMKPVPIGIKGELCIAGEGTARGYLNHPELTAEKFDQEFYRSYKSYRTYIPKKLYKTGDWARWFEDGNIEFLGRQDQQVKIRGFRIETGEIENRLLAHDHIKAALVTAKEDQAGDKYLAAYVIPRKGKTIDSSILAEYLSAELPDFMVPSYFIQIERIPLTANGKVDHKALSRIGIKEAKQYTPPQNPLQARLVDIWAEVIGIDKKNIGIDTSFFKLGGHSLKATILVSRVRKEMDVDIPLVEIFKTPFIKELAQYIMEAEKKVYTPLQPVEKKEYYPLSSMQKRLFIIQQLDKISIGYNMPAVMEMSGTIDRPSLEIAFMKLIKRHESLRTSFKIITSEPVQQIHDQVEFEIEYYLATENTEITESKGIHHSSFIIHHFVRPFDFSKAPLFRVGLIKESKEKYLLMVDMHHIISDGISLVVLLKEFMALLEGTALPALNIQYKDFSQWQNSNREKEAIKKQGAYWMAEFASQAPVLNLPIDYPRPPVQDFAGAGQQFGIESETAEKLKALAFEKGVTPYMLFLAIFNVLLSRLSGQEDIIVGSPTAGRRHADLDQVVGMFVNTLVMRNYPHSHLAFTRFLAKVKERTLNAFENQDYPFEELVDQVAVDRDISRNPLFDVMFALQDIEGPTVDTLELQDQTGKLKLKTYEYGSKISKFDLLLAMTEAGNRFVFSLIYSTKLFKEETIHRWIGYFKKITVCVSEMPDQQLSAIDWLPDEEKEQILHNFNAARMEYPRDKTIHELFDRQVEKAPDYIALVAPHPTHEKDNHRSHLSYTSHISYPSYISYKKLEQQSHHLACRLKARGIQPDTIVAIRLEPSIEMIIGILGILKAGAAYLPINPKNPGDRIKYMLVDSGAKMLISDRNDIRTGQCPVPTHTPATGHWLPVTSLAYIIYTSGSTGKPKGVPIAHANFSPLVHWGYTLEIGPKDRVIQNLSYYFDWSVWEIFIALTTGAALYMITEEILLNPEVEVDFILENAITVLHITPSQCWYLLNVGKKLSTLRNLFIGAEKLGMDLVKRSMESIPGSCRLFNMYGPTEATIISAVLEIHREEVEQYGALSGVPIGKPVGNTALLVLDRYFCLCPLRVMGELYIAGDGVARGYLNNPELTAEKFIIFNKSDQSDRSDQSDKVYKTGDLAWWLPDGNIEFLGRIDHQVKIRGFRIEPQEIEYRLLKHEEIEEAVVTVIDEPPGKALCAYFVSKQDIDISGLRRFLAGELPGYMVPSYFVSMERMPLTANGKLDRQALPHPDASRPLLETTYVEPGTYLQQIIADTWKKVLGKDTVGIDDNFFDLGGNSLDFIMVGNRLKETLDREIPVITLFTYPTVRSLETYLSQEKSGLPHEPGESGTGPSDLIDQGKNLMRQTLDKLDKSD